MKTIPSRVIQGMVMPGGWHFDVNPRTRLEAETFPDLVGVLTRYRISNTLPIGDPLKDIEEFICTKYPHQCHRVKGATVVVTVEVGKVNKRRNLLDRIILWFEAQLNRLDQSVIVLPSEAQRRASICAGCPANQEWKIGCVECAANITRLSKTVRQGHQLPRENKLKGCAVFGHENRAAVWLKRDRLGSSDKTPPNCWLKS